MVHIQVEVISWKSDSHQDRGPSSLLVFVPLPTSVYPPGPSLPLLRLGVHAGLPRVPGHLRHGDDQQGDAGEKEEDEPAAGASKRPGVVIFDPDGVLALNHALDGLPHHFQRDEGAEACRGDGGGVRQSRGDAAPDTPKTHPRRRKTCRPVSGGSGVLCLYRCMSPPNRGSPGWRRSG